jgi:hypothetical protein
MELKRRSFLKTVGATAFAYLFLKNNGKPEPVTPKNYTKTFEKNSIVPSKDLKSFYGQATSGNFICSGIYTNICCSGYVNLPK